MKNSNLKERKLVANEISKAKEIIWIQYVGNRIKGNSQPKAVGFIRSERIKEITIPINIEKIETMKVREIFFRKSNFNKVVIGIPIEFKGKISFILNFFTVTRFVYKVKPATIRVTRAN